MSEGVVLKLRQAAQVLGLAHNSPVHNLIATGDLLAAADELRKAGDLQTDALGSSGPDFWESLRLANYFLGAEDAEVLCRLRHNEACFGFVEVALTLLRTEEGGRSSGIRTNYRPSWDIGTRTAVGGSEINDAAVSLEECQTLAPGETGLVRLHPLVPASWNSVRRGQQIKMQEGSRVLGHAEVVRVALKATRAG